MSALDDILNDPTLKYSAVLDVPRARAELAQLRASFATLKARCDELTKMEIGSDAEIERLHNAIEALTAERNEQARRIEEARDTIAGQAEQLRNSTDLIRRIWEMADDETSKIEIETASSMWQIEADTRAWLSATAPAPNTLMNLDAICERVHAEWMNFNRRSGAESRLSVWGEELMKPWNDLSERAKDLDRCTIRAVLDAFNAPAQQAE